jgi:hypothetical protein
VKFKEFAEIEAMVGQTYGEGKEARTITRITGITDGRVPGVSGTVYWKRPGGKERRVGKYLPHFLAWIEEQEKKDNQKQITRIDEVELYTSELPEDTEIEGYIERVGNDVTIRFKIK